jgi:hypothetical protein
MTSDRFIIIFGGTFLLCEILDFIYPFCREAQEKRRKRKEAARVAGNR